MDNNKKIAVNSIVIFVKLCVTTVIGLLTSRFVLQALGASDYGLYNVVGGMVVMLNVLNTSMVSTTYRYIAYEMGKGDSGNPNKVFNTSFAIHAGFALLIVLFGAILGEWYIANYLNVDSEKLSDAKFVFRISILTTVINTCFVPYNGLLVALEKFTITAIFEIIQRCVCFAGVVWLLSYFGNRLRLYSIIILMVAVVHYLLVFWYSFKHSRQIIKFQINKDGSLYKEMLSFAGWILFGAGASVGKSHGSVLIINYFFGTLVNAAYGVAYQVENFILMFSRTLNHAAVPQITKSFSGGDSQRSIKLASYISKYTFILMSLVAFPVMLDMDFLLGLWLKNVPEGAGVFCRLMVLGGLLGCMGEGIPALVQATGKIKVFHLVLSTLSLLGLPIAVVCYYFGAPAYSILVIYCVISVIAAIIRLYLLKRIINFDVRYFIRTSYLKMFLISCPLFGMFLIYNPTSFSATQHVLGLVGLEVFLIICIWVLGVDHQERRLIANYIKNFKTWKRPRK